MSIRCCPQPTQHGANCQECKDYMPAIGAILPQNAEWVNGIVCTYQCLSGFLWYAPLSSCIS